MSFIPEIILSAIIIPGFFFWLVFIHGKKPDNLFRWHMLTAQEAECLVLLYRKKEIETNLPLFEELRRVGLCYSPHSRDQVSLTLIGYRVVENYLRDINHVDNTK